MNIKAQGSFIFCWITLQNAIYNWDIYWRFWDLLKKNLIWVVPIMLPVHRNQTRQQMMHSLILGSDVHHQISWHHWIACQPFQSLHGCGSMFPNLLLLDKGNKRQTELDWGGEGEREGTTLYIVSPTNRSIWLWWLPCKNCTLCQNTSPCSLLPHLFPLSSNV
jgi:hypothetical protein